MCHLPIKKKRASVQTISVASLGRLRVSEWQSSTGFSAFRLCIVIQLQVKQFVLCVAFFPGLGLFSQQQAIEHLCSSSNFLSCGASLPFIHSNREVVTAAVEQKEMALFSPLNHFEGFRHCLRCCCQRWLMLASAATPLTAGIHVPLTAVSRTVLR